MTTSTIHLMRHGEPEGGGYYRGITDDPLTQTGWRQMNDAVAGRQSWEAIISSPLVRCLDFASDFCAGQRIPLVVEPRFKELDFGLWEGKTADEISQSDPNALINYYADPVHNNPHKGEDFGDFNQRIAHAWNQVIAEYREKRILIITHAGVIRMLIGLILEVPLKNTFCIQIEHACMIRVQCYHSDEEVFYQLRLHGD